MLLLQVTSVSQRPRESTELVPWLLFPEFSMCYSLIGLEHSILQSHHSKNKKKSVEIPDLRIFSRILFVGFIADLHLILIKVGS